MTTLLPNYLIFSGPFIVENGRPFPPDATAPTRMKQYDTVLCSSSDTVAISQLLMQADSILPDGHVVNGAAKAKPRPPNGYMLELIQDRSDVLIMPQSISNPVSWNRLYVLGKVMCKTNQNRQGKERYTINVTSDVYDYSCSWNIRLIEF